MNPQGGDLSSADNLRTYYIPKVAEEVHGTVSVFLDECRKKNGKLFIIVDESTDQRERQRLNILVRVGDKTLLLESVFLHEPANHANVAVAVNDAIILHQLRESVFFLITDNAAYSNTRETLTNLGTKYWELKLELAFVSFYGKSISDFIELFELKQKLFAHQVYNIITNFQAVLETGRTQVQFSKFSRNPI